jgi:hypothetical protein
MTNRKFYRTKVTVEVLSEDPIATDASLYSICEAITTGGCSGVVNISEPGVLNGKEAAVALLKQGSDPEFFRIDEQGKDL